MPKSFSEYGSWEPSAPGGRAEPARGFDDGLGVGGDRWGWLGLAVVSPVPDAGASKLQPCRQEGDSDQDPRLCTQRGSAAQGEPKRAGSPRKDHSEIASTLFIPYSFLIFLLHEFVLFVRFCC